MDKPRTWIKSKDQLPQDGQNVLFIRSTGEEARGTFRQQGASGQPDWNLESGVRYFGKPEFWCADDGGPINQ